MPGIDETLQPPPGTTLSFDEDPPAPSPVLPPILSTPGEHPAANIPFPGEQQTPPAVQPGQAVKQSTSANGSYRGVTQQGLAVTSSLNKKADQAALSDVAQFAPQFAQERADYERVAQERRQANQLELEAQRRHAAEEQKLWEVQRGFITEQHELEKQAYAQSQVVKQQYLANYEHDLMSARMLAMQTGDPYERMSAGQAVGLIAAHAVQGFLKVGGHNIDVAEQTNRWVNREIAKHQQLVQDTQQAAQGQFHLYQLARQNAMDDYEARERYRGMVMEGLKAQVGAEAARFGSQMATATAAQKAAEIDAQLVTLKANLGERQRGLYFEAQKMRINQAAEQARNSVAMYSARTGRLEEERLAAKQKAELEKTEKGEELFPVYDPFEPIGATTQPKWGISKDDKDAMHKFREKETATRAVAAQLDKLEAARARAYKAIGGAPMSSFVADRMGKGADEMREYKREHAATVMTIRKANTGAAFTKEETAEYLRMLPGETFWEAGDNVTAVPQLRDKIRTDFQAAADTYSTKGKGNVAGPTRAAEYSAMMSENNPSQSYADKYVESTDKLEKEKPQEATRVFKELMGPGDWSKGTQPAKMTVVEDLAKIYLSPAQARREHGDALPANDDLVRAQAREALQRIAADPDQKDVYLAGYAQIVLDKANEDPATLAGLLGMRQVSVEESSWSMSGAPVNSGQ